MIEIGKAEFIAEYEEQINYLENVLSVQEELESLYAKDTMFEDEYKEIKELMKYVEERQEELKQEKEELETLESKREEDELKELNNEFERSRL